MHPIQTARRLTVPSMKRAVLSGLIVLSLLATTAQGGRPIPSPHRFIPCQGLGRLRRVRWPRCPRRRLEGDLGSWTARQNARRLHDDRAGQASPGPALQTGAGRQADRCRARRRPPAFHAPGIRGRDPLLREWYRCRHNRLERGRRQNRTGSASIACCGSRSAQARAESLRLTSGSAAATFTTRRLTARESPTTS